MNDDAAQMIATSVVRAAMGRGATPDIGRSRQREPGALRRRAYDGKPLDRPHVPSRLNDPATGAMVLIMQRLHELDPTGYLLEQEPGVWTLVRIPLEAEDGRDAGLPALWESRGAEA